MPGSSSIQSEQLLWAVSLGALGLASYVFYSKRPASQQKYAVPSEMENSPQGAQVKLAVQMALQAGQNMYAYCDEKGTEAELKHDLGVQTKSNEADFCTKIDVENESFVMAQIQKTFPSHKIIGEETTGTGAIPPLTKEPTWIIDPIDGTTNFSVGLPLTCVSIGYCEDGKPVMGVVYAPMTDELYIAVKGYGAYRNGVRLLSQQTPKSLKQAVVCVEFGYTRDHEAAAKICDVVLRVLSHGCRAIRQIGSGVLDIAYIATGRLDAVYAGVAGEGWKPWDFCAGFVIASEAGCIIEAFDQQPNTDFDLYSKTHICATNATLLSEIRGLLQAK